MTAISGERSPDQGCEPGQAPPQSPPEPGAVPRTGRQVRLEELSDQCQRTGGSARLGVLQWSKRDTLTVVTFSDYAERWLAKRKVKGRPLAAWTLSKLVALRREVSDAVRMRMAATHSARVVLRTRHL